MASPQELHTFASYSVVAPTAVLMYDYLLTLSPEVCLVWNSPWSVVKVLFLLARYTPFISLSSGLYYMLVLTIPPSPCHATISLSESMMFVGIAASLGILFMRTWALWNRDARLGVFLGLVFGGGFIGSLVIILLWVARSILAADLDKSSADNCSVVHDRGLNAAGFGVILVMETVVLVLTIVRMVRQYSFVGKERVRCSLESVLYRDGMIFFVHLFLLSVINITMSLTRKGMYRDLVAPIQQVFHSVLSTRVLLNLRAAQREEHTMMSLSDVEFVSRDRLEIANSSRTIDP